MISPADECNRSHRESEILAKFYIQEREKGGEEGGERESERERARVDGIR